MEQKPTTSVVNGRFWGSAAADWATIQEPTCLPVYAATFDHVVLGAETTTWILDVGREWPHNWPPSRAGAAAGRNPLWVLSSEDFLQCQPNFACFASVLNGKAEFIAWRLKERW
jgi:hypothetical protein